MSLSLKAFYGNIGTFSIIYIYIYIDGTGSTFTCVSSIQLIRL